jgi:hypothetical protein
MYEYQGITQAHLFHLFSFMGMPLVSELNTDDNLLFQLHRPHECMQLCVLRIMAIICFLISYLTLRVRTLHLSSQHFKKQIYSTRTEIRSSKQINDDSLFHALCPGPLCPHDRWSPTDKKCTLLPYS